MKNTLKLYEELRATGISDEQAKVQAYQLGDVRDLSSEIREELRRLHSDMNWIKLIGASLIAAIAYMFVNLKHLMN